MDAPHQKHPSLMVLAKQKSAAYAKEAYLEALSESEAEPDKDAAAAVASHASLSEQRLSQFSNKGEKYFKVLVSAIPVYKDKQLKTEQTNLAHFNINDVFKGTFVTNKIVLISHPHNVYVDAQHVEPIDIDHSAFVHRQREQQQVRQGRQKSLQAPLDRLDNNASQPHGNGMDEVDAKDSEKIKLLNDADIDDPSLSDTIPAQNGIMNGMNGYTKVSDINESEHEDVMLIINGGDDRKNRRMQVIQYSCIFFGFLVLLILDICIVVFLSKLQNHSELFTKSEYCDEKYVDMVYMDGYMSIAVISLLVLIALICVLLYFAIKKLNKNWKPNSTTKYVLHTVLVVIIMYVCIAIWQSAIMCAQIKKGIAGIRQAQNECVSEAQMLNSAQQLDDDYSALNPVIILKLIQAIVLVTVYIAIFCWRWRSIT